MKIYSSIYNDFEPFETFYPEAQCIPLPHKNSEFNGPSFLVIWGGGDIHPSLYDRPNVASQVGRGPSIRDEIEVYHISRAIEKNIPIVGVCRGAQLGCVAAGGILIQHADQHATDHFIETSDGRKLLTSSLHHQIMFPWQIQHELLAHAAPSRATEYFGISEEEATHILTGKDGKWVEPEIVWFPTIKCLAIQGHPEYMDPTHAFNSYVKELIDRFIIPLLKP